MEAQIISNPRRAIRRGCNRQEQSAHVDRWHRSGLSAKAYAREHTINHKSLYAWRSRLRLSEAESRDKDSRSNNRDIPEPSPPAASPLIPVRVGGLQAPLHKRGLEVTLRASTFECVLTGASSTAELVELIKSLKQAIFDV